MQDLVSRHRPSRRLRWIVSWSQSCRRRTVVAAVVVAGPSLHPGAPPAPPPTSPARPLSSRLSLLRRRVIAASSSRPRPRLRAEADRRHHAVVGRCRRRHLHRCLRRHRRRRHRHQNSRSRVALPLWSSAWGRRLRRHLSPRALSVMLAAIGRRLRPSPPLSSLINIFAWDWDVDVTRRRRRSGRGCARRRLAVFRGWRGPGDRARHVKT